MTDDQRAALSQKLLGALARREHSRHELLAKYGEDFDAELLCELLDDFAAKGWQSDARFAASYARSAVGRGKGELFIRQHLRRQGVMDTLIDDALAEYDFYQLAEAVYTKKYRQAPSDRKEIAKRQRFLAGRGFSFEQINEVLNPS